jgi:hypothetical protein
MYARVPDNVVLEIIYPLDGYSIDQCFSPEIVATLIACDSNVQSGWTYDRSTQTFSPPVVPNAPTVSAVSPATGSVAGGLTIIIAGQYFTPTADVTIEGIEATNVTYVSDTTLTAVTPAGTAGSASVVVITSGGRNTDNTLFTYEA